MFTRFLSFCSPVLGISFIASLLALAAGCSRSKNDATADTVPMDIRGEAISAPATNAIAVEKSQLPKVETQIAKVEPAAPSSSKPFKEEPAKGKAAAGESGFTTVSFVKLASFKFEVPDDQILTNQITAAKKSEEQIPAEIKAFDQKPIALKGFMLPLKVESGLVTEMLIMKDQSMCCYGSVPKINEWVSVKMTKGVKPVMDQPVTVYGTLHVGEMRENGYLVGIYQMDGQKMADPEEL